jgi:hypothetical protein
MEVAATVTVWLTFSSWLFLGTVPAPALFSRTALSLCGAELLAAATWSFTTGVVAHTARQAAAIDIPALTGIAIGLGTWYGLRAARAC